MHGESRQSLEGQPESRLRVGFVLPSLTLRPSGAAPGWSELRELAATAEAVGFDSVWVADELLYRYDDAPSTGWWECWSLLSAIAAVTQRVELGTFVTCTNYRSPTLVAKMAATVDEVSGGRLILGLGAGWSERQFREFGFPADHLYHRFEEALVIIHGMLRDGRVSFKGRYQQADGAELLPRGPRPNGVPIMVGGKGPSTLRLATRFADLWNVFLIGGDCTPERAAPILSALEEACAESGRDPATLARSAGVIVAFSDEPFLLGTADWARGALRGTAAELVGQLRAFEAAGFSLLQIAIWPTTQAAIEQFGTTLELLRGGVPVAAPRRS